MKIMMNDRWNDDKLLGWRANMWQKIRTVIVLITLAASVSSASGEEMKQGGISLDSALTRFYQKNYDIIIARYEIDKAYADYVGSKLFPNPNLSLNYIGMDVGGRSIVSTGDNTQLSVRLDQLIELGGKMEHRIKAASETLESARLTHKDTIRTLLSGFFTAYFNLALDSLILEEAKEDLERYDKVIVIGKRRFDAGFLSLIDYKKLTVARIDFEKALNAASVQLKNDLQQFMMIIASESTVYPSKDELKYAFMQYTEDELLNEAYANRYDMLSLQRQFKASEAAIRLSRANAVPDITIGLEYDGYNPTSYAPTIGLGISIGLPVFNRNQGEILRRVAESDQIARQLDRIKKQIVLDVRTALNNYKASVELYEGYSKKKDDVEDLLKRSEKAFAAGGITVIDLLDTEKMRCEFVKDYNAALVQGNLNRELLKVYTGGQR